MCFSPSRRRASISCRIVARLHRRPRHISPRRRDHPTFRRPMSRPLGRDDAGRIRRLHGGNTRLESDQSGFEDCNRCLGGLLARARIGGEFLDRLAVPPAGPGRAAGSGRRVERAASLPPPPAAPPDAEIAPPATPAMSSKNRGRSLIACFSRGLSGEAETPHRSLCAGSRRAADRSPAGSKVPASKRFPSPVRETYIAPP